jgi:hypothetical protein
MEGNNSVDSRCIGSGRASSRVFMWNELVMGSLKWEVLVHAYGGKGGRACASSQGRVSGGGRCCGLFATYWLAQSRRKYQLQTCRSTLWSVRNPTDVSRCCLTRSAKPVVHHPRAGLGTQPGHRRHPRRHRLPESGLFCHGRGTPELASVEHHASSRHRSLGTSETNDVLASLPSSPMVADSQ